MIASWRTILLAAGLVLTIQNDAGAARKPRLLLRTAPVVSNERDLVVMGRVLEVISHPQGPNDEPGIHTSVRLAVDGASPHDITFWMPGGELGNRRRVVTGQARFSTGEQHVVFLRKSSNGSLFPISRSSNVSR